MLAGAIAFTCLTWSWPSALAFLVGGWRSPCSCCFPSPSWSSAELLRFLLFLLFLLFFFLAVPLPSPVFFSLPHVFLVPFDFKLPKEEDCESFEGV